MVVTVGKASTCRKASGCESRARSIGRRRAARARVSASAIGL